MTRTRIKTILSERPADQVLVADRPSPDQLIDRDLRAMLPARDLTGAVLGDPPVGRSALDKKIKEKQEAEKRHDGIRQPPLLVSQKPD